MEVFVNFITVFAWVYLILYTGWVGFIVYTYANLSAFEQQITTVSLSAGGVIVWLGSISWIIARWIQ